jgi:tryptophan-rich sensory protein
MSRKLTEAIGLVVWLGICFGAAALGSSFTALSVDTWYPTLAKPSWTPSGAVIGAIWTVLYTLMGVAAWLVWRRRDTDGRAAALTAFMSQLTLNTAWSGIFFGLRMPGLAVAEVLVLETAVIVTIMLFRRVSPPAAWLLAPYAAWTAFAAVLNVMIWRMNP